MNALTERPDTTHAVIWEADPQTLQFTYVSRGAETLLGYTLDQWLTSPSFWIDLLHPYDRERAYAECRAAVETCQDHELEYRVIRSDGRILWLRDMVRVVCDGSGKPAALRGVMLDITDRRRADGHGKRMEILGQFAEAIAHDLSNLLTTIQGNVDLAITNQLSLGVRRELQEINQAAVSGAALLHQLLAFGHRATGPMETIDVHAKLHGLQGLVARLVGESVAVRLAMAPQPAPVRLSQGMLEQVIMNLAVNARDAMPGGGRLEIATQVHRASPPRHAEPGHVEIGVTDTGTGMNRHTRDKIFEPFFTTKDPGRGTGLGLSTVFNIVTDAGGHIDVDTEIGRGTRFTIRLPLAR